MRCICVSHTVFIQHEEDSYLLLGKKQLLLVGRDSGAVCSPVLIKFGTSQLHGCLEVLALNSLGDALGQLDSLHQRLANNLVLDNANNRTGSLGGRVEDSLDGFDTLQSRQHTVVGNGSTTTLDVTKSGDSGVETKLASKQILDLVGRNSVELTVVGSLSNNDNCLSLSELAVALDNLAHLGLPVFGWRVLGKENEVGTSRNTGHQGEPTTVSAHDLDDEGTLVRESGSVNVVDSLADALQRRVASNGGIGTSQVVVNGTDQTNNVEMSERLDCLLLESTIGNQLLDQTGPLASESVCTSQTAVTTTDNQGINALVNHVLGRLQSAGTLLEGHASCCSDEGTTF